TDVQGLPLQRGPSSRGDAISAETTGAMASASAGSPRLAQRLPANQWRYRGQPPTVLTPTMEARVLEKTRQAPPDGSTHWSTRKLGRLLKIHHNLVGKTWRRAGLQPHRFERYMQSDDP